jgi:hypothetical protein
MLIKEIKSNWYMLTSDDEVCGLVWFGYSKAEVIGKFTSWLRRKDLERLR